MRDQFTYNCAIPIKVFKTNSFSAYLCDYITPKFAICEYNIYVCIKMLIAI